MEEFQTNQPNRQRMEHITLVKYLGVTLNQKYNFQQAMKQLAQAIIIGKKSEDLVFY